MYLSGKTVLVTGAAGRIGSSVAKHVLASGANVVLSDIAFDRLKRLEADLNLEFPGKSFIVEANLVTDGGIDYLLEQAHELAGVITSAVHCAYPVSAQWGSRIEDLNLACLFQDLSMQLGGAILFSKKIIEYFRLCEGGDLVHISSIQGISAPKFDHYEGTQMTSPVEYAAIKSGIIAITRWLAKYFANQGIRVNCVSPGGVLDDQPSVFLERYRQSCTNIGMLSADQVASAIVYLLSPQAAAINGHNLIVDDGWSL